MVDLLVSPGDVVLALSTERCRLRDGEPLPLLGQALRLAKSRGGNLRAPHHTISCACLGAEIALAAGGVLLFDGPLGLSTGCLQNLHHTWLGMPRRVRPVLVFRLSPWGMGGPRWPNRLREPVRWLSELIPPIDHTWVSGDELVEVTS